VNKLLVASIGALASFAAIDFACAADMAVKAPVADPWTWTGVYVGGNGGYSWGNWDSTSTSAIFPGTPTALGTTASPNVKGWFGGLQAGYNWQFAPQWVVGIEGDVDWSGENASDPGSASISFPSGIGTGICDAHPICTTTIASTTNATWNLDWFATLRGRLGFVVDQTWLLYGTGGIAFAGTRFGYSTTGTLTITNSIGQVFPGTPISVAAAASGTSDRFGFAAGGGVEKMLSKNWSIKAEYLFLGFGTNTFQAGTPIATTVRLLDNIVRGGVNYKF
jgi:outer membrane immunogenic protein